MFPQNELDDIIADIRFYVKVFLYIELNQTCIYCN